MDYFEFSKIMARASVNPLLIMNKLSSEKLRILEALMHFQKAGDLSNKDAVVSMLTGLAYIKEALPQLIEPEGSIKFYPYNDLYLSNNPEYVKGCKMLRDCVWKIIFAKHSVHTGEVEDAYTTLYKATVWLVTIVTDASEALTSIPPSLLDSTVKELGERFPQLLATDDRDAFRSVMQQAEEVTKVILESAFRSAVMPTSLIEMEQMLEQNPMQVINFPLDMKEFIIKELGFDPSESERIAFVGHVFDTQYQP